MPNNLQGMQPLMTLDQHNEQERLRQMAMARPGAGVACPNCATEMVETHPGTVNASNPPTTSVHCPNCGRTGLKY